MLPMGTWYVATLLASRRAATPTRSTGASRRRRSSTSRTTGTDNTPVTFGDPTGLGDQRRRSARPRLAVAKAFLAYAAGPDAGKALAGIGITPANSPTRSPRRFSGCTACRSDDLSKFAWTKHNTKPENPVSKYTAGLQNLLNEMHTAILSGSKASTRRSARRRTRAKNEVLNQ